MISLISKTLGYVFAVVLALISVGLIYGFYYLINHQDLIINSLVFSFELNFSVAKLIANWATWALVIIAIIMLGPIMLRVAHFFQQQEIIELLTIQNDELRAIKLQTKGEKGSISL
jgi:ABC-type Na+ efflux pump permease subunit